ncbi:vWA domain-containing protein [Haloechinothrix halophila]|uniref:vWA domain-containing protein n=1 Tax=Haloechinothrix halophila TaxID=1069073 RepID=UPI00042388A5|nr:VWA domain-containing protein [Haloechinothrix halophila]
MTDGYADLAGFGDRLRQAGVAVSPATMVDFCAAAVLAGPDELYWSGKVTLVSRPQDLPIYDRVFAEYFAGTPMRRTQTVVRASDQTRLADLRDDEGDELDDADGVASATELLRRKDFAALSSDELRQLAALLAELNVSPPPRRSRRWRPARRGKPDLRRTVHRALRSAGEPLERPARVRRLRARRLIFILDVSHSMVDYARALLMFAHAGARSRAPVDVFCFGTRLTRLTAMLSRATPEDVLARAADVVLDWDGGTRIGDSIKQFLDSCGHSGLARGAVVVVCSDGLDTGDPDVLSTQMARLSRLTHRVIWLNPLSASAGYEPLARGMRAALPHVDVFASGHNLADLQELAHLLAGLIEPYRQNRSPSAPMP